MQTNVPPVLAPKTARRGNAVTIKLLFIAALVLFLQLPLHLVGALRVERARNREEALARVEAVTGAPAASLAVEGYRMVERSLKHSVLVLTLVLAAFFLFEMLVELRLHAVHYGLVGAALCLFYLALLALGEVFTPGRAYAGAATASSLLIVLYSASILRSRSRALVIAGLLTMVHSVLYIVLRMEDYALLAGTTALFAALAAVMYFTRDIDWFAHETARDAVR